MKKKKFFTAKKIVILVILVVVIGFVAYSCSKVKDLAKYTTVEAQRRDIMTYLEFTGNIAPVEDSKVYSKVSGNVLDVLVEEGSYVKEGDVIAILDSKEVEYQIALSEKNLEKLKLQNQYTIKDAKTSLSNIQTQIDSGLNKTFNMAETSLHEAEKAFETAAENYNEARVDYLEAKADYDAGKSDSVISAKKAKDSAAISYDISVYNASKMYDKESDDWNYATLQARVSYENAKKDLEEAKKKDKERVDELEKLQDDAKKRYEEAIRTLEDAVRDYQTTHMGMDQELQGYKDVVSKNSALLTTETDEMQLEHLKESLDDYVIKSNLDGYIITLGIQKGDTVGTVTTPVAEIMNLDTMQVDIKIDEYDLAQVSVGEKVDIYVNALDTHYEGIISKMARIASGTNGVSYIDATVEFQADEKIISGLSAEIKLVKVDEKDILTLPTEVIEYEQDNRAYVLQYDDKGNETKKYVSIGVSDGEYTQITEGITDGEAVLKKPTIEDISMMMEVE